MRDTHRRTAFLAVSFGDRRGLLQCVNSWRVVLGLFLKARGGAGGAEAAGQGSGECRGIGFKWLDALTDLRREAGVIGNSYLAFPVSGLHCDGMSGAC